jgi:hypothetical protein
MLNRKGNSDGLAFSVFDGNEFIKLDVLSKRRSLVLSAVFTGTFFAKILQLACNRFAVDF